MLLKNKKNCKSVRYETLHANKPPYTLPFDAPSLRSTYRFWNRAKYWLKLANFPYAVSFTAPIWVIPFELLDNLNQFCERILRGVCH